MNRLKRLNKSSLPEYEDSVYWSDNMDSFLSQIADRLEEARRLREKVDECLNLHLNSIRDMQDVDLTEEELFDLTKKLVINNKEGWKAKTDADAIEEEVIKALRGE